MENVEVGRGGTPTGEFPKESLPDRITGSRYGSRVRGSHGNPGHRLPTPPEPYLERFYRADPATSAEEPVGAGPNSASRQRKGRGGRGEPED
jgi:hypothetical protein